VTQRIDELSSLARGVSDDRERRLEEENAALRVTIAALHHDLADLRASAMLWRKLYEKAIRRCAERDGEEV